jgi:hypothetical protein
MGCPFEDKFHHFLPRFDRWFLLGEILLIKFMKGFIRWPWIQIDELAAAAFHHLEGTLPVNRNSCRSITKGTNDLFQLKLPAHRAGLPGKEIFILIVPLDPAYKAGLAGHLPVREIKPIKNLEPTFTKKEDKNEHKGNGNGCGRDWFRCHGPGCGAYRSRRWSEGHRF